MARRAPRVRRRLMSSQNACIPCTDLLRLTRCSYVYKGGKIECKDELEAYIKEHGKPDNNGIDPHDRSTWTCHKDAEWLAKYPECVAADLS